MTYKEAKDKLLKYFNKSEALLCAIEALNRMIPKVPNVYGDGCSDGEIVYDMWECPRCGTSFEIEYEKHDYCPNCGQAIDWSDYREDET